MKRLTIKEKNIYTHTFNDEERQFVVYDLCKKLGQLEDIEEELGIDLITLFKALKEGVWYKFKNNDIHYIAEFCLHLEFYDDHFVFWLNETSNFNLKDYGKTWSLRKEDLEDE